MTTLTQKYKKTFHDQQPDFIFRTPSGQQELFLSLLQARAALLLELPLWLSNLHGLL